MEPNNDMQKMMAVQVQQKSAGISFALTFFFGGLGLFYTSPVMAIVATLIDIVLWIVTVITLGLGMLLLIPAKILWIILGITKVTKYNKDLLSREWKK